ncbi:hypothetical protein [Pantoea sp. BAV 3049]|uniref:hypothetical protein n=1 Tax=Pantoea sp. BAV 3049 TaxID=2654188 RepID=UPI00131E77A2|nr:hypothetical protein [Pantoea sp. BAV 3049]
MNSPKVNQLINSEIRDFFSGNCEYKGPAEMQRELLARLQPLLGFYELHGEHTDALLAFETWHRRALKAETELVMLLTQEPVEYRVLSTNGDVVANFPTEEKARECVSRWNKDWVIQPVYARQVSAPVNPDVSRWQFIKRFMRMRNIMNKDHKPLYCLHIKEDDLLKSVRAYSVKTTLDEAIDSAIMVTAQKKAAGFMDDVCARCGGSGHDPDVKGECSDCNGYGHYDDGE